MNPKLQGDEDGERAVRGILLGVFLGISIWAVAIMVWWAWVS